MAPILLCLFIGHPVVVIVVVVVVIITREHWIWRITFAAETNAACSRGHTDTHIQTPSVTMPSSVLRSLSGGEVIVM